MSEKNRGISFETMDQSTSRDIQEIQHDFASADHLPATSIKMFAKEISAQINSAQTPEEQKVFLIDVLQDEALERVINLKTQTSGFSKEEIEDIKKMAKYSTKQIKKAIVEELKKYLPEELYFFIKKYVAKELHSHSTRMIIENRKGELFFKTSDQFGKETKDNLYAALEKLKIAMSKLADPTKEMPFLSQPLMVNKSKTGKETMAFASQPKDLVTIQEIFEEDEKNFSLKEKLKAIIDCLRGAKFLAENGLTLTDLSTTQPGRNMGIDKKTKKGILFDLDGLMIADTKTKHIIAPMLGPQANTAIMAPEYLIAAPPDGITTRKESMLWEFGLTINRLAEEQLKILWASGNIFTNHRFISLWEKLKEFSHKMTADKPEDRPSFDICIMKLEGIVDKYLD